MTLSAVILEFDDRVFGIKAVSVELVVMNGSRTVTTINDVLIGVEFVFTFQFRLVQWRQAAG